MGYERAINVAYDRISEELLDAVEIFRGAKNAFEIRRQYHAREIDLFCYECEQGLGVSTSKYDRLFFKHHPNSDTCILKDGKLTPEESEQFDAIYKSKESDRHKYLKNKIAELLRNTPGVEPKSVIADKKYLSDGSSKRRPDVFGIYQGKQLVFEIQLSNLPLKYILDRYNFYKGKGIYLIWVLDNFDVQAQSQMVRDIKYLSDHQNFFKLDETTSDLKLICTYKKPFINERNKLISPWRSQPVPLADIKFDQSVYQIYYYNYDQALVSEQKRLEQILLNQEAAAEKAAQEELLGEANETANDFIYRMADHRKRRLLFYRFPHYLDQLDELALEQLRLKLDFAHKLKNDQPLFHHYLLTAGKNEYDFLDFLAGENRLGIDINQVSASGGTAFQAIQQNPATKSYRSGLVRTLLKRGYIFKVGDRESFFEGKNEPEHEGEFLIYELSAKCPFTDLVDPIFYHSNVFFTLSSLQQGRIIHFKLKGWKNIAINAVQNYKQHWPYVELAMKKYGIWDLVIADDQKGTFLRKLEAFYAQAPEPDHTLSEVIRICYPEIFDQ